MKVIAGFIADVVEEVKGNELPEDTAGSSPAAKVSRAAGGSSASRAGGKWRMMLTARRNNNTGGTPVLRDADATLGRFAAGVFLLPAPRPAARVPRLLPASGATLGRFAARVFRRIVWRFLRNGDVMRVTLPDTGW